VQFGAGTHVGGWKQLHGAVDTANVGRDWQQLSGLLMGKKGGGAVGGTQHEIGAWDTTQGVGIHETVRSAIVPPHTVALGLMSPTSRLPSLSAFQHCTFTSNDQHIRDGQYINTLLVMLLHKIWHTLPEI